MKRTFSNSEKTKMIKKQFNQCSRCGLKISLKNSEGHHEIPYSIGGPTLIWNGSMVCKTCHKVLTNQQRGIWNSLPKDHFGLRKFSKRF